MIETLSRLEVNAESASPRWNQSGKNCLLTHPSERLGVHSAFNQPLRAPKIKSKSEAQGRTPELQGRCFCARCFEDAVGFRLNDAEASEGVA